MNKRESEPFDPAKAECGSLGEVLREGRQVLEGAGIEDARTDAWLLFEETFRISRALFLADRGEPAPPEKAKHYLEQVKRRAAHIPLAYILGKTDFYGRTFLVDDRVLIPRQDTEILVEEAQTFLKERPEAQILDLCCGSGCILLSLLLEAGSFDVKGTGTDISPGALEVALSNCRQLGIEAVCSDLPGERGDCRPDASYGAQCRCELARADLFDGSWFRRHHLMRFDIITCNPPYIPTGVIPALMEEVRLHEPLSALDGGEDGLDLYRRLAAQASAWLKPDGRILCEIGYDQGDAVRRLFTENGFGSVRIIKDLAGLDRVVSADLKNAG